MTARVRIPRLLALSLAGLLLSQAPARDASAQPAPQEASAKRGWLGVQMSTKPDPTIAGVAVLRSIPASPADDAGLELGDVVTSINGTPVRSSNEMIALLSSSVAGASVRLEILGPRARTIDVLLSAHPGDLSRIGRRLIGRAAPTASALNVATGVEEAIVPRDGKVRIVEIWATWCGPCKVVMPAIARLNGEMDSARFEFVGVATEDRSIVQRFLARNPASHRILADPDELAARDFWISATPTFVLIDQRGQVVDHVSGIGRVESLFERAKTLIAD